MARRKPLSTILWEDLSGKIGIHFHEVKQVGPDLRILARFD